MSMCERCGVELHHKNEALCGWEDAAGRTLHTDARCAERLVEQRDQAHMRAEALESMLHKHEHAASNEVNVLRARCSAAEARVAELTKHLRELQCDSPWDELAKLLGCPQWDYPGQIIRDVKTISAQARAMGEKLRVARRGIANALDNLRLDDAYPQTSRAAAIFQLDEALSALALDADAAGTEEGSK